MKAIDGIGGTYPGPADKADETPADKRIREAAERVTQAKEKAEASTNFVDRLFNKFEAATVASNDGKIQQSFHEHLTEQIDALGTGDSSDPQKLARYQKAIMMFTVHSNAQSSMVKSVSDLDKSIVRDFN